MIVEGTLPARSVSTEVQTDDPKAAATAFVAEHPGARPEMIDNQMVRGSCCGCGRPVMEHDEYLYDPEHEAYTCVTCRDKKEEGNSEPRR